MLVSSIARLNVHNTLNNSASRQNNNASNSLHTFGGEHDLSMLNKINNRLSLDLSANKMLYNVSYLQEKFAGSHNNKANAKKSLNVLA